MSKRIIKLILSTLLASLTGEPAWSISENCYLKGKAKEKARASITDMMESLDASKETYMLSVSESCTVSEFNEALKKHEGCIHYSMFRNPVVTIMMAAQKSQLENDKVLASLRKEACFRFVSRPPTMEPAGGSN